MRRPDSDSLDFLLQADVIEDLLQRTGTEQWQPLRVSNRDPSWRFALWCALLDDAAAKRALDRDGWDLSVGDGKPGFSQSWPDGKETTTYHRYGIGEGIRPLVHYRSFHGAFPKYYELDEEFRHYHDLAHDQGRGLLLAFDSSGRETEVVRFVPDGVEARLKYLRQFQAGTRLHLAVYIDSVRYSPIPLDEVGERHESGSDERARWRLDLASYGSRPEYETLSRVLCKVIMPPPPLDRAGVWPFEGESEDDREVSFIVGVDANGDSVEFTSNPHVLADYLGANADAPHYLTPVYFRREVLSKYFAEPERYSVEDGLLRCLGLWNTQSLQLKRFRHIHDVRARDPELLPSLDDDELTRAQFAEKYLRAALNDKFRNRTYSKRNPTALLHRKYLEQLQVRLAQTGHIRSFEDFLAAFE